MIRPRREVCASTVSSISGISAIRDQTGISAVSVSALQIPFPGVAQDVEVVQVFREIVSGEADRLLFVGDHPGKVSGGKIGLCPCVMRKRDGFVQTKNPVGQRPQVLVGGIREKVRQSRGIGRVNAHGVSRFPKIVQEGSAPDPNGEQSRDSVRIPR